MLTTFDEVALHADKTVLCAAGCKRRLKRTKRFFQTLNPFNKDAEGKLKTREQIRDELRVSITAWKTEPVTCSHCEKTLPGRATP